jgi:hypothetical protein
MFSTLYADTYDIYLYPGWRVDVPREAMLAKFSDFDAKWQQFLGLAPPTVTLSQLRALEPIHTWSRGKACILGDAAHAMFQGMQTYHLSSGKIPQSAGMKKI